MTYYLTFLPAMQLGGLQGCVLAVVLLIINTNARRSRFDNCVLIKCDDEKVFL